MTRVTFLHPDLGIGGAERLVVDAALALKKYGNTVNIVTTHHDKNRAFEETVNGEIPVTVVGNWIPRSIFGRFYALMAYLKMIYAAFYVIFCSEFIPDVAFCDLVSVAVPILRLRIKSVIFYCHFPDQLLSQPEGCLKAMYRVPLNWLEEISTASATHIFVNSKFTAGVFQNTFQRIKKCPDILYPSLNMSFFDSATDFVVPNGLKGIFEKGNTCFLSINRYERKKDLSLALYALSELKALISDSDWDKVHLIVSGGYDVRVTENVEYFEELSNTVKDLDLVGHVTFLRSMSDAEKISLLKMCSCLIYTPSNEHFGIVPIEAMYMSKPVIAVNSGGPTETIENETTGFLCPPTPPAFADAMSKFVFDKSLCSKLGEKGRERVNSLFSFSEFSTKLNNVVKDLVDKKKQ
ncbi:hypothetical protein RUM44_012498 [Polyplax serrata]|uniref:Alpha-1,3/1,6-mannosyltransferase ALG2 n=1 Tax=Polyplax serrata TaxID=468196 RepID=A0ABR1BBF4_POLSC